MSVCLHVTTQELLRLQFCFTLHEELFGFLCAFWVLTHIFISVENVSHRSCRENGTQKQ